MKDECDVCGEKLPLVSMPRKDGLVGAKTVAVVGMMLEVMDNEMCANYGEGTYVVCRNCTLAALGVRPTKGHVIIGELTEN